jgi:hypothetical protein
VLKLDAGDPGIREFEQDSIAAAADVGNMNDASTGKLPSAGIAAKAIYALQYADEKSIAETSTLQDLAMKKLAEALDQITRVEYQEQRKIPPRRRGSRVHGRARDQSGRPRGDVDYTFTPGSMLSRQKESVKNELIELMKAGLIDGATVKKHLSTAVPDVFRTSYNLQEAKARRLLQKILRAAGPVQVNPAPFDDPAVCCSVIEEFALTAKWDLIGQSKQQQILQLWQTYKQQQQLAAQQAAAAAGPQLPHGVSIAMKGDEKTVAGEERAALEGLQPKPQPQPGAGQQAPAGGGGGAAAPIGAPKPFSTPAGAATMEQLASSMAPPTR